MEFVVGILVIALICVVGFAGYSFADAKASRRLVEWNERTNPSHAVIDAIRETQLQSNAMVANVSATLTASVRSMLGMDQPGPPAPTLKDELADEFDEIFRKPFAETDPYMNDDLDEQADNVYP